MNAKIDEILNPAYVGLFQFGALLGYMRRYIVKRQAFSVDSFEGFGSRESSK